MNTLKVYHDTSVRDFVNYLNEMLREYNIEVVDISEGGRDYDEYDLADYSQLKPSTMEFGKTLNYLDETSASECLVF